MAPPQAKLPAPSSQTKLLALSHKNFAPPSRGELAEGLRGCFWKAAFRSETARRLKRRGGMIGVPSPVPSPEGRGVRKKTPCQVFGTGAGVRLAGQSRKFCSSLRGSWSEGPEGVFSLDSALAFGPMARGCSGHGPCPLPGRGTQRYLQACASAAAPDLPMVQKPEACSPFQGAGQRTKGSDGHLRCGQSSQNQPCHTDLRPSASSGHLRHMLQIRGRFSTAMPDLCVGHRVSAAKEFRLFWEGASSTPHPSTQNKQLKKIPAGHRAGGPGTAYGIRTRVTSVRGWRPRPLDERGIS